jgi:hypothetical protein
MALPPPQSASQLDSMPPSPGSIGNNPGTSPTPTLGAMGGPLQIGSAQLPPEILQGALQVGQNITELLDGLAQVTPDLGMDWQAVKQLLLATLAKLVANGAPPASATSPGSAFPGVTGGMDRGQSI